MSWSSLLLLFCHVSTLTHIYRHFKYEIPQRMMATSWCRVPRATGLPTSKRQTMQHQAKNPTNFRSFQSLLFWSCQANSSALDLGKIGKECWKQLEKLWGLSLYTVGPTWSNLTPDSSSTLCILIPRSNQGARKQQPAERKLAQRAIRVLLRFLSYEYDRTNWAVKKIVETCNVGHMAIKKSTLKHVDKNSSRPELCKNQHTRRSLRQIMLGQMSRDSRIMYV